MRMQQFKRRTARQKGFTLIELIIVIVIVGILAAVAIPKYMDMTTDANKSVANGFAGAFAAAAAANYAICSADKTSTSCKGTNGVIGCDATGLAALIDNVPSGITLSGTVAACKVLKDNVESSAVVIKTL